jgi:hypothetical protein
VEERLLRERRKPASGPSAKSRPPINLDLSIDWERTRSFYSYDASPEEFFLDLGGA